MVISDTALDGATAGTRPSYRDHDRNDNIREENVRNGNRADIS